MYTQTHGSNQLNSITNAGMTSAAEMRMSPTIKPDMPSTSNTRDIGIDPMCVDSSMTEITHPSIRSGPGITTNERTTNYFSAKTHPDETPSAFQTAHGVLPTCKPYSSSTRKQEIITIDSTKCTNDSTKSTRGSGLERPPAMKDDEPISPEQLKFTEAISNAMSKEWAPLIADRNHILTRPTIYKGTKDGSIDGWLPLMRRFLERVHTKSTKIDKAWAIIDHLQNEARNYIINKSESERGEPEKVFTLLASRYGTGGNRMHVRQTFMSRTQEETEDWLQYLDP